MKLMDMMLQAQGENKDMSAIIGNDYEKFCQSISQNMNQVRIELIR